MKYNLSLQAYLFLSFWLVNRDIDVDLENILVLLMLESDGVHVLKEEEVWNDQEDEERYVIQERSTIVSNQECRQRLKGITETGSCAKDRDELLRNAFHVAHYRRFSGSSCHLKDQSSQ